MCVHSSFPIPAAERERYWLDGARMVGPAAEPRDQKAQALHLATWQLVDAERTTV